MRKNFNFSAEVKDGLDAAHVLDLGEGYISQGHEAVGSALTHAGNSIMELVRR